MCCILLCCGGGGGEEGHVCTGNSRSMCNRSLIVFTQVVYYWGSSCSPASDERNHWKPELHGKSWTY